MEARDVRLIEVPPSEPGFPVIFDAYFRAGDFQIVPSDDVHIEHILVSHKGWWRQFPVVGVGVDESLLGAFGPSDYAKLRQRIVLQLENDGYLVYEVTVNETLKTTIEAKRQRIS